MGEWVAPCIVAQSRPGCYDPTIVPVVLGWYWWVLVGTLGSEELGPHNALIASGLPPLMEPFSGVRNRVSRLGPRYYYRTQRTEGAALKCGMFGRTLVGANPNYHRS